MKNLSIIINAVLLIAVIVLFYLQFSTRGTRSQNGSASSASSELPGDLKIAYVNSDSLLKYYDFFKSRRDILEAKTKKLDSDFQNRAEGLQRDITSYQNNVGNLTMNQAKAIEEDITKKQQNLRMYQERVSTELANDENNLNRDLYDRVTAFLKKYGDENGIQLVLKFDPSSDVLFGNPGLDITQSVIDGLNEEYAKEKKPAAQDSTASKKN